MHQLKEYNDLKDIEGQLLDAGKNVDTACDILHDCIIVCQNIEQHKLYQALKKLDKIKLNLKGN